MDKLTLSDGSTLENPTPTQTLQDRAVRQVAQLVLSDSNVNEALTSLQASVATRSGTDAHPIPLDSLVYTKAEALIKTVASSLKEHGITDAPTSIEALKDGTSGNLPARASEVEILSKALQSTDVNEPSAPVSNLGKFGRQSRTI
jgi:hypothetical protein